MSIQPIVNSPELFFIVLFIVARLAYEAGYGLASWSKRTQDEDHREQIVSLRDGLLVLLSLLLGFTFAMAVGRFEQRRQLVVDEANAIGSTSLRARMLPEPEQTNINQLLRQYAEQRLHFGQARLNSEEMKAASDQSEAIQKQLWDLTISVSARDKTPIFGLFMQSLNETIDLHAKRLAALENRIPGLIWILIAFVGSLTCLCAGFSSKKRFWFPALILPLMIAAVVALISDLDSPRHGFIHISQGSMERLQQDLHP